jgi:hypothetical protein
MPFIVLPAMPKGFNPRMKSMVEELKGEQTKKLSKGNFVFRDFSAHRVIMRGRENNFQVLMLYELRN